MALSRRSFISRTILPGMVAGLAPVFRTPAAKAFAPGAEEPDADVFADARRQFLIPEGIAYCNTGTLGACPREVVDDLAANLQRLERELADWPYYQPEGEPLTGYQPLNEVRAVVGSFVNASAEDIALTQNATMGMNFLANGLDLEKGDEVVSTDQEHVGGICPWRLLAKRRGVVVKELGLLGAVKGGPEAVVKAFGDAMTPRTRVLMISHITSGLGIKTPIRELCSLARERGALSLIDGAQAVGQIQVDVKKLGCDAYVASPHKWLLAPKGTGFLYVRKEAQSRFWTTLASAAFEDREKGAFRFMQYGTGSLPAIQGLVTALRFIGRIGMERIERWDSALTKRLRDGLSLIPNVRLSSPTDPRFASAITTFRVEGMTGKALQDALWARRVRVRSQGDDKGVRLSAHLYVSPKDVDTVLETVESLPKHG